jgi:DNA invertase Pin-like site-specific DNA recombinase
VGQVIGYARTSTTEQLAGLDAQKRDLGAAGIDRLFAEQLSSVDAQRPQLDAALDFIREGDVLVVTKIDRLARSVANLVEIEKRLHDKGASLRVLDPGLDTGSPIGRLVFNMVAAIAQFEREIMLERQREGIAKAKEAGKYKGRAPTARAKAEEACELLNSGMGATEVAKKLGIGRASVYRIAKRDA